MYWMETALDVVGSIAEKSGVVGGKRTAAEDGDVSEGSQAKRIRGGSERREKRLVGDVKKVAEIVLVLAAMGKMRGGRGPTKAEKELMNEARKRLAKVCEGFAPKDVFPGEVFGGVIEDLGLGKLKEQRMGFTPLKMSIAEKMLVSMKKMEKAVDFPLPSTLHSSRPQGSPAPAVESHNGSQLVQMPNLDKPIHVSISSGSFQTATALGHGSAPSSAPLAYQLPTSEIRPIVSSALPSGHLNATAMPRVNKPHVRSDGRLNGTSHPSQVQANYSANVTGRTPTWSVQHHSGVLSKSGSDAKAPLNVSLQNEEAAGVKSGFVPQTTSRTVIGQTVGGLQSQGYNQVHSSSLGNTHAEIGKIVQKLLQPRATERPTWNPPSRDYMNKALTCQVCMSMVTEIDSILICDACEKGYHLKCIQTSQKGVPRGEWHCGKCLSLSNGKPLPPKYGRVMRNTNTAKTLSNSATDPASSSKRSGVSHDKVGQLKAIVNGNPSTEGAATAFAGNNDSHQIFGSAINEARGTHENNKVPSGDCFSNLVEAPSIALLTSLNSMVDRTCIGTESNSSAELRMLRDSSVMSQAITSTIETSPSKQSLVRNSKEYYGNESSSENQLKEQEIMWDNPSETSWSSGDMNQDRSSGKLVHSVKWIGDPTEVSGEKYYYTSCFIGGHLYRAMDHVLIRFANDKPIPAKLQTLWEDKNTAMKWVTVNQCYFADDLPESVGCPCGMESAEVCESTRGCTCLAGLIEGPCEVLPPRKFAEESERRARSSKQLNDHLPPLYLCKWIYDEAKGLFRDVSY